MFFDLLHVRIRIKLLGLVLLPVVGGGVLSGLIVADQARLYERMQRLRAASGLSLAVGHLVHALQGESAQTALRSGTREPAALAAARNATNQARLALDAALQATEAAHRGLIPAQVQEGGRLKDLRRRADRQAPTADLVEGYGREVDALVQVQDSLMLPAAGTPLETRFQAFARLLRVKVAFGQEGAVVGGALAAGTLDGTALDRLQTLLEARKGQAEAFLAIAPAREAEAFRKALAGEAAPTLEAMRAGVIAGRLDQDPAAWGQAARAELSALQAHQDRMNQGLLEEARALEQGARTKGWMLSAGFGIFGLVVLVWTWRATVLITEPIQELAEGMARLQKGDLSIQLPVHSYDETGRMTQAFNAMSAHLRELVRTLQGHAARVTTGASTLSASAEQVSAATQQLGRSSRVQRLAFEQVVSSVDLLQSSVVQVRASLDAMVDGGQAAAHEVQDATRRARTLMILFHELAERSESTAHETIREGEAQIASILQTLTHVEETLGAIEAVAEEIHRASEAQSAVSREVSERMGVSQHATGEVQQAAAQLANTAPEVVLTTRDLVQVAQSLKASAAAFRVE